MTPKQILSDMKKKLLVAKLMGELTFELAQHYSKDIVSDYIKNAWNNPSLAKKIKKVTTKKEGVELMESEIQKLKESIKKSNI